MWREITCLKFQDKICSSYWFVENRDFGIDSRKFYVEGKWESMGWEGHVSDVQNNYTYENCTISKDYKNIFVLRSGHRYISVFFIFFNFRVKIKSISLEVESFSKQNFSTNQNAVYLLSDWSEIVVFDLLNKMFGRSDWSKVFSWDWDWKFNGKMHQSNHIEIWWKSWKRNQPFRWLLRYNRRVCRDRKFLHSIHRYNKLW